MFATFTFKDTASGPNVSTREPQSASPRWSHYRTDVGTSSSLSRAVPQPESHSPRIVSPTDIQMADSNHETPQLTRRTSSSSRHSRRSSRSPAPPNTPGPLPEAALFPYPRNQHIYRRQNVPPSTINASSSYDQPGPSTSLYGFPRPTHPLGSTLPSFSPSQYGSISAPSERPRTSHQVFHTTSDLVAHHGLPQSLPPVPRTTRYSSINVPNSRSESISESASNLAPEFPSLLSNYLAMIEKPADTRQEVTETVPNSDGNVDNGAAVQALMEVLQGTYPSDIEFTSPLTTIDPHLASPEFRAVADFTSDFNDFLTSPMESPWDDFLTTPVVGSADMGSDLFTSPAIVDGDDFDAFDSQPLFGDSLILSADVCMPKADVPAPKPAPLPTTDFDGLYTMPSPSTPALDPASLHASPRAPSMAPPPTPPGRRSKGPTGTRKNITPDALVPMDAPIQPRKYVTPSSTSRKEVPAVFARKRARSSAFGEEEDLRADDLPAQDLDAIEAKRRQNTLAARRSRKRKLEHQRQLELQLDQESTEKEMWKARATMFEALLRSHGHEVPVMNS